MRALSTTVPSEADISATALPGPRSAESEASIFLLILTIKGFVSRMLYSKFIHLIIHCTARSLLIDPRNGFFYCYCSFHTSRYKPLDRQADKLLTLYL